MKKLLFSLKHSVWAVALLGATTITYAQQPSLKSQAKPSANTQTLKNQQVFSSDAGPIDYREALKREDAIERAKFEFERLKDPSGKIPNGIRKAEIEFSSKIAIGDDSQKSLQQISKSSKRARFSNWKNRGPANVGGRTRAVAVDRNNENVILAGGVSGGLWRSQNGGRTWRKVTRRFQNPSVTAIVQDPRPGRGFTWYYAGGERRGSGVSAGGAFFQGNGIFKSQDGGRTWEQLRATLNENVGAFESPFDLINDLVMNPTNGDLFVATFNGIFRSQDGGNSFEEVLETGFDSFAEMSISPTGIIYASTSSNAAPNTGFLTSSDNGETWTNITPPNFIPAYGRSKIGIDHSNESTVYFFTQDRNPANQAVLFRYDALAPTLEEAWVDLTANLPVTIPINFGIGDLNLQGGYNMVCEVHPTQSNIVFVGGTCLYRSNTGFTTPAGAETWIGGNGPGELDILLNTIGRGASYTNQHADQHVLVFFPSNPNKAIAGHDGGLSLTEDITVVNDDAEQVTWESLNNNYVTTHPYHVAFDPQSEDENLLAGFQDNGSWFTNSSNPTDDWDEQLGADGGYNAIADNGRTHYVSVQNGIIRRLNLDEEGNRVSFATVHPAGATGFAFINPFALDPIKDNVMYVPGGNTIWRNNNLDEIPLSSTGPTPVNWVNIETSATPVGTRVTALEVSKFPVANRLYYGTNAGQVFRMDNANIDGQQAVDITTGKGLPTGFVNDINIDASNSDRVIVTFSNYGIPSVFITEDGGDTWTNISGNLEENPDGSGNGPSVRSTAFFGGSQGFFGSRRQRIYAATSTGLYYTTRLNGENTVWRKENVRIGSAVTDEVVARKDGFIAIASGGSGMFSARFPVFNEVPEPTLSVAFPLDDFTVNENSEDTEIDVTGLFVQSQGRPIDIEVTNTNPELVTATLVGDVLTVSYTSDAIGVASIGLIATSGEEQVSEGFTITVAEPSIYEQTNAIVSSLPSQNFLDFGGLAQSADDFTVPAGDTWSINRVLAFGSFGGTGALNNVTVVIYEDNAGLPGDEVYNSGEIVPLSEADDANLNIALPEAVTLESGNYWISVYVNLAFAGSNIWSWLSQDNVVGEQSHFRDVLNLFGTGAVDWTSGSEIFGEVSADQRFQIFGDITGSGGDETEGAETELATIEAFTSAGVHPNPSNGEFIFNFGDRLSKSGGKTTVRIYNSIGRLVQVNSDISLGGAFVWNASNFAPGLYFAKFSGDMTGVFKLVKQ